MAPDTADQSQAQTQADTPPDQAPWADSPLARLDAGDRDMIVEFVLQSGSLKALAKERGVSYPTIRQRLDGVIARLRAIVDDKPIDPLAQALAELVERGELTSRGARRLLEVARRAQRTDQDR